uniref:Uncharacterized protein n=1 Tax=Salix viminalis TaxID=40686 RepID=A0A6N2NM40_SALVM
MDDLLQKSDDTMFDNPFIDKYIFDYYDLGDNKDDKRLDLNMTIDVDDDIISHDLEFKDFYESKFVISHKWIHSHRCFSISYYFKEHIHYIFLVMLLLTNLHKEICAFYLSDVSK